MADREEVLQAVLDKLWSSAIEFSEPAFELQKRGQFDHVAAARERWQKYAEELLLRWLEYHSPSAADRAREARRG